MPGRRPKVPARAAPPALVRRRVVGVTFHAVAALMVVGCSTVPTSTVTADERKPDEVVSAPSSAGSVSSEVLLKVLVAEFAARRGELSVALDNYLAVARETGEAAAAERAVRIAVFARDETRGLEAAELWVEVAPGSTDARQVLAALQLRAGKEEAATEGLIALVPRLEADTPGQAFARISDLLARERDKAAALRVMERVVAGHEEDAAALFAFGNLLARSGELARASEVLERVIALDPDLHQAVVLLARIRQREGDTAGALDALAKALERRPDDKSIRMTYARLLVDAKRFEEAREQFERLSRDDPSNKDVKYALGLLMLQTNRPAEAKAYFEVLTDDPDRRDAAWYYLGQIAEVAKDPATAMEHYRRVDRGEHRLNAQVRLAALLADSGEVDRARSLLQGLRGDNSQESVRLVRAEAEILVRHEQLEAAMGVYDAALLEMPSSTDLLYARAMLAEKLGRLEVLERDLRDILSREPNNADALNALGYTLADRTDRVEEAYELVKRALELKPDDHYVIDSMGWVLYRLGRHQEALEHLRRAMAISPDAEIAAHLGEVLWVLGEREEARSVWETALKSTPEDKKLLEVKRRFGL